MTALVTLLVVVLSILAAAAVAEHELQRLIDQYRDRKARDAAKAAREAAWLARNHHAMERLVQDYGMYTPVILSTDYLVQLSALGLGVSRDLVQRNPDSIWWEHRNHDLTNRRRVQAIKSTIATVAKAAR